MKVGVIGGGQFAQMLAQAANSLGIKVYVLTSTIDCSAKYVAKLILGNQADLNDITNFSAQLDVLSFESENVNFKQLAKLALPIYPPLLALKITQDRELEKKCFIDNNIPTTQFQIVASKAECIIAIQKIGLPAIIKICRGGYDGKGQAVIYQLADLEKAWSQFEGKRLIVENLVKFEHELSIIAVRDQHGNVRYYPLTENFHQNGILQISKAPYDNVRLQQLAENYADQIKF
jgi:5-(carboxyamino)imidazole ribonucleotide synthase